MINLVKQGRSDGHTLVELVVVLAVFALCILIPVVSIVPGLEALRLRGGAQLWQTAVATGQIGAIWGAEDVEVSQSGGSLDVSRERGSNVAAVSFPEDLPSRANISRWAGDEGAALQLGAPCGSPDGAGSGYRGDTARRARVVIRAESGLTWRAVECAVIFRREI